MCAICFTPLLHHVPDIFTLRFFIHTFLFWMLSHITYGLWSRPFALLRSGVIHPFYVRFRGKHYWFRKHHSSVKLYLSSLSPDELADLGDFFPTCLVLSFPVSDHSRQHRYRHQHQLWSNLHMTAASIGSTNYREIVFRPRSLTVLPMISTRMLVHPMICDGLLSSHAVHVHISRTRDYLNTSALT